MTLTKRSLSNPVAVVVACILIVIFGALSLTRLPIQMTPEISRPEITVMTPWRASAPNGVESEIIEPREEVLRGIPGLLKMQSTANYGMSFINLQFEIGTEMNRALIEVLNRLNQVLRYPVDADEPVISVGGDDFDKVIAWRAITAKPGNTRPVESYQDFGGRRVVVVPAQVSRNDGRRAGDSAVSAARVHSHDRGHFHARHIPAKRGGSAVQRPGRDIAAAVMASLLVAVTVLPAVIAVLLVPPADYLPEGRKNFVMGFTVTPPGMGTETARDELVEIIDGRLNPYLLGETQPRIKRYFLGSAKGWGTFIGGEAVDDEEVEELIRVFNTEIMTGFPDTFGFAGRDPIFGGSRGGRKIAEVGWNRTQVATVVRAKGDGALLGEYFDGNRRYNVVMRPEHWYPPEDLGALPVATANGSVQTIGELARITRTAGPSNIRRIDRRRTLTLEVTPPAAMAMEEALDIIKEQVAPAIQADMPQGGTVRYRGTAEALDEALASMAGSFALAVVILYLLISALFRSFRDSLLVSTRFTLVLLPSLLRMHEERVPAANLVPDATPAPAS